MSLDLTSPQALLKDPGHVYIGNTDQHRQIMTKQLFYQSVILIRGVFGLVFVVPRAEKSDLILKDYSSLGPGALGSGALVLRPKTSLDLGFCDVTLYGPP